MRSKITPASQVESARAQQDGNNLGSDSDSETTGSAYDLDSIKINQRIIHEGEEEIIEGIKGKMKDLDEA